MNPLFSIQSPFYCDFGFNISIGENFFSNYNLVILDVAPVIIGDNVLFGPNVSLYTAGHPIHPISRNSGYEYGIPITIGDNVWLGGNVVVTPGVTIGENSVVAAGSVVVKDIPANVVAAGLRAKDSILKTTEKLQASTDSILAEAQEINETRDEEVLTEGK